jgi:hypothetical protein
MDPPTVTTMENTIAKDWYKSSFSANEPTCVEARFHTDGSVDIRNSNEPDKGCVSFNEAEWKAFLLGARAGEFDAA